MSEKEIRLIQREILERLLLEITDKDERAEILKLIRNILKNL